MLNRFTPLFLGSLLVLAMAATLLVFCGYATAAPTLTTAPYPAAAGQPTADRADSLAAVAVVDCEEAAKDRMVNKTTRAYYAERAAEFRSIVA